ncbi:protein-L-isoaspartate O-methyltransferase [Candidatus Woesearchaeota archaeon]|nr:protein-L-isoaspartate O-methyltransferase [Candidatus Woesearchaeota archaeon]
MNPAKEQLIRFWKENFHFREQEIQAFSELNREEFLPEEFREKAYEDRPQPLLRGKTISQPTTVMIMTSALELKPGERVFEVGTGSGYQAAMIGKIVGPSGKVVSTEIIPELVNMGRTHLKKAGITNVVVFEENGAQGHAKEALFDKIIITAACKEFPKPLLEQLKPGGIIVGPVGTREEQEMIKGVKDEQGRLRRELLGPFLFTPMYGSYGFEV